MFLGPAPFATRCCSSRSMLSPGTATALGSQSLTAAAIHSHALSRTRTEWCPAERQLLLAVDHG